MLKIEVARPVGRRGGVGVDEKRRHGRVTVAAQVNFSSDDNFYAGATRDISLGGLFLVSEVAMPIGTELTVLLKLPSRALSLRAEVVWTVAEGKKTTGLGLRFVQLPTGAKNEIEAFMQQRAPIGFSFEDTPEPPPVKK
jgi:uncharacterized protein (TIGR02266 family)